MKQQPRYGRRGAALALFLALHAVQAETATANPVEPSGDPRGAFIAAMQRVREGLPDLPDPPALQSYVIHDYLVAARLRRDLARTPGADLDETIDGFLKAHQGQPVSHALRHDWLANLAGRQRWDWYLPRAADVTDPALICDRLDGRLASGGTAGLAQDAMARFMLPQKPPEECRPIFAWLRAQKLVTPEVAVARTRAALSADNARLAEDFLTDVPQTGRASLEEWIRLLEAPKASVALLAITPDMPVDPDALVAGFSKLAIGEAATALTLLPALAKRPDMTPALQLRLQRAAALGAAYSRSPAAVGAFGGWTPDAADTQVLEWRVRAALWSQDFPKALEWLDAMPSSLAALPRWRYWRARSVAATSGAEAAAALFAPLAGMRDFYGYLSADHLKLPYALNMHASPNDIELQTALSAEPALIRAHALFDCELSDDASAEWSAALGGAKAPVKVQAAHLAAAWGWYAQTIATLAQAGEWDDVVLRYPRPYPAIVAAAARAAEIPVDWIYGIMRQESLFRKDAVSRADARGLMQMQPATATAVARRWHLPPPSRDALFDPTVAVPLGAYYVRELLDKYRGQLDQSLAAYNAGPAALARWQPADAIDADIWIENVPYTETRSYIEHIVEHVVAFAAVQGGEPPRLSVLLPPVTPPGPVLP
jgi:soluble lytic murein transglycosylase